MTTEKPKRLSDTAGALLAFAAKRDDHLIRLPRLPAAAARQVVRSLLTAGSAEEVPAPIEDEAYAWRTGEDGQLLMLWATEDGLARLMNGADMPHAATPIETAVDPTAKAREKAGVGQGARLTASVTAPIKDPPSSTARDAANGLDSGNQPFDAPTPIQVAETVNPKAVVQADRPVGRTDNFRQAALAVLAVWDANADRDEGIGDAMDGPFAGLRTALASMPAPSDPRRQPKDTKQARVLAMLRRNQGASGPQIAEAMGWAPHTVRGFLTGLAKKGFEVAVLDRVRQVGPNKSGSKGSYTVYHVVDGAEE